MLPCQPQASPSEPGRHLLLFDGLCGLCSGLVRAILKRDRLGVFHLASLQSPVATSQLTRLGRHPIPLSSFVVIANYKSDASVALTKVRAALFVLTNLSWPWKAAALLRLLPISLLDRVYDVIARNRFHILGRHDHCSAPPSEYRSRFLDSTGDVASRREVRR